MSSFLSYIYILLQELEIVEEALVDFSISIKQVLTTYGFYIVQFPLLLV